MRRAAGSPLLAPEHAEQEETALDPQLVVAAAGSTTQNGVTRA